MKLREIKTKSIHYFRDEQGRVQGEYNLWYESEQQWVKCHIRDSNRHGEYKEWDYSGKTYVHTFNIDGKEIINFLENPELYPTTPEERTMFILKYGNAPLIGDPSETN